VDGTGPGSCLAAGFHISGAKPSVSAATVSVALDTEVHLLA
jgi:hypothetical protein